MKSILSILCFLLAGNCAINGQVKIDSILKFTFGEKTYDFIQIEEFKYTELIESSYKYRYSHTHESKEKWKLPVSKTDFYYLNSSHNSEYFDSEHILQSYSIDSLVRKGVLDVVLSNYNDIIALTDNEGKPMKILGFKFTSINRYGDVSQGYQHFSDDRPDYKFMKYGEAFDFIIFEHIYFSVEGISRAYCIVPTLVVEIRQE